MKTALEWTRKETTKHGSGQIVLSYFFNGRAPASLEKSSLELYRSLVYQLLQSCASIRPIFKAKFALKEPGESGDAWTKNELQDFLDDLVISGELLVLYMFIDALDEGEQEDDVREMIGFLTDLAERALSSDSSCQLRICLSSRHYPHISIRRGLSLSLEEQPQHSQDIDLYIHQKLIGVEGPDKNDLCIKVRGRASNVFLWVVLVVDILNKIDDYGGSLTEMSTALDTIPGDLNNLFQGVLTKAVHDIEASIAILQWVMFAERTLTAEELYLAVEYGRSSDDSTLFMPHKIKLPPRDRLERYILNHSLGLVELTTRRTPTVQFIHETVREFLVTEAGLALLLPTLTENLFGISHENLKTSCARYLAVNPVPNNLAQYTLDSHWSTIPGNVKDTLRTQIPFIGYATTHLLTHAEQAQKNGIWQVEFLKGRVDAHGLWRGQERLYMNLFQWHYERRYTSNTTLLYFAAEQGYDSLSSVLIEIPCSLNAVCGRHGSALQAACARGHEKIVRLLIHAGADVNLKGGEHGCCLNTALMNNRPSLIPTLLENQARAPRASIQKALFFAIAQGSLDLVDAALDAGADVNSANHGETLPLAAAMLRGFVAIADLLLQHGADINGRVDDFSVYDTALQIAVTQGNDQALQMLLDAGADVSTQGGRYGNALQVASKEGRVQIVKMSRAGSTAIDRRRRRYQC